MTGGDAKRIVVGSMAVTGALGASRDFTGGRVPRVRILIGIFGAGMALAILSEAAPDLAGTFALLIMATAVFTAGAQTWGALGRLIGR